MPEAFTIYPKNRLLKVSTGATAVPNAYTVTQPSETVPTGAIISGVGYGNQFLVLSPYATNTTGAAMGMRVVGYNHYTAVDGHEWYIPQVIATFTMTRTSGVAPVFSIDAASDTVPFALITLTASLLVNVLPKSYIGPAAGLEMASCAVDTMGADIIQLQFQSPANQVMGAFYRFA
jgi:hypothetical protein